MLILKGAKMNKAQWAALHGFCEEFGYTRAEVLAELKANGAVDKNTRIEDLGEYTSEKTYDSMLKWLADNL